MNNTKAEFQKRIIEVDIYFQTLDLLDKGRCKISCIDISGILIEKDIDDELSKILKANGFLLLYNLIEATIRKSIDAIISSIHSQNITFKELTENLKIIWVNQEIKDLKENTFNSSTLRNKLLSISQSILADELLTFKAECINISGNIDAQKIRDIAKQLGYDESTNGRNLVTIKTKRNHLAHGEYTFAEIGKDYTVKDLVKFKEEAEIYLADVLLKIENYINNRGFKIF